MSLSSVGKVLCLLLILVVVPVSGSAQQGTREVMADAMTRMMEAMGLFDSARLDSMSPGDPLGGSGWGSVSGASWGSSSGDRSQASAMQEMMQQFARQMTSPRGGGDGWPAGWTPSRLEGVWEGRDGELLLVQGNRFRIYSSAMQRVDGLIQIRGNRLALYNPLDQRAQPFEFAESQGRLVMRDLSGQVYLYRRLLLDGGQGGTGAATWTPSDR